MIAALVPRVTAGQVRKHLAPQGALGLLTYLHCRHQRLSDPVGGLPYRSIRRCVGMPVGLPRTRHIGKRPEPAIEVSTRRIDHGPDSPLNNAREAPSRCACASRPPRRGQSSTPPGEALPLPPIPAEELGAPLANMLRIASLPGTPRLHCGTPLEPPHLCNQTTPATPRPTAHAHTAEHKPTCAPGHSHAETNVDRLTFRNFKRPSSPYLV